MATVGAITLPSLTVSGSVEFSVARLRGFVTSSLSDADLGTLLTAALDDVDDALGPATCRERLSARGDMLALSRKAASVTSIVEDARWSALTLAADDYELSDSGMVLYRLRSGTNPRWHWHGQVIATYVREADAEARIRAAVALVQLDLDTRSGVASEKIGTWEVAYRTDRDYLAQRNVILASLTPSVGIR